MTNQPFAVPGARVRWAVAELRKAGINADVQRGPGGAYYITVDDDDHDWAAGTLGPMMAPPTMRNGRGVNLSATFVSIAVGAGILWLVLSGATPAATLTGVALIGLQPELLAGLRFPLAAAVPIVVAVTVLAVVALRNTNVMFAVLLLALPLAGIATGQWALAGIVLVGVIVLGAVTATLRGRR